MSKISYVRVHNQIPAQFDIAFIGDFPSEADEVNHAPMSGPAGNILATELSRYNVQLDQVALLNLSQYKPQFNNFALLNNTYELQSGKREIDSILAQKTPTVITPLSYYALEYLTGFRSLAKYRGSILSNQFGTKTIPTYHPSYIARNSIHYPTFSKDIERIVSDSKFNELNYSPRNYYLPPSNELNKLAIEFQSAPRLAVDIETVRNSSNILCVGFADSPSRAICLPFSAGYMSLIINLLTSPAEKIFQNGLFDYEQLRMNGIVTNNYKHDTLIMHFALEPELPRGLDYMTSIYTREPYYKESGRGEIPDDTKVWSDKVDKNKLYIYNAKDCVVTYEIASVLLAELESDPIAKNVYEDRMESQLTALHISETGMLVDQEKLNKFKLALTYKWDRLQFALNIYAHSQNFPLPKAGLNVNSKTVIPRFLYTTLKLPTRRNHDGNITADEDAIVALITFCENKINESKKEDTKGDWRLKQEACKLILEIRGIRKLLSSYINITLSPDGRARSSIRVAATETGRWAASKFVDGSGLNNMTLPRNAITLADEVPENFDPFTMLEQLNKEDEDVDSTSTG